MVGTITEIKYNKRLYTHMGNMTKHKEDRVFILNNPEKLKAVTHVIGKLSDLLKKKLKIDEKRIEKLQKDFENFSKLL